MSLFFRDLGGENTPILILHGLFGSSKNWISIGKSLTQFGRVLALDLRNHGESFHADSHSINDLVSDLYIFLEEQNIDKSILIGHSMGGLTVARFALECPERVEKLIVVDIALKKYNLDFEDEFHSLEIDPSLYKNREGIDKEMSKYLSNSFVRSFLQMNLTRTESGVYQWKINVQALKNYRKNVEFNVSDNAYSGKTLFIKGGKSDFLTLEDIPFIEKYFPNYSLDTILDGDHYLHYTRPQEFLSSITRFLEKNE